MSRILFGIITFVLLITNHYIIAFIFYFLGVFTDALDGYLARKLKKTSKLGGFLDALIDRIFILVVALGLLISGRLNPWILLILIIWMINESIIGELIFKKIKKIYLPFVHRNSIRYAAFFLYITIGLSIIDFKYLNVLALITIVTIIYVFIDYITYYKKLKRKN